MSHCSVDIAAAGAHVVGVARHEAGLNDLQQQLGASFTPVVADVTGAESTFVDAYAADAGIDRATYLEQFGTTLTAEQVAGSVVELATTEGDHAPAYVLNADGLSPFA